MAGTFLSMEGMDGAGKSTQIDRLAQYLRQAGRTVRLCRDPGGTVTGETIREFLLHPSSTMSMRAEMLLYMASRAQLVDEVIRPALERGEVVICDRFLLSTVVYQGHAGGIDAAMIWRIGTEATGGLLPDWTGVLDLPPEESARRRVGPADRIEQRSLDYFRAVRAGYIAEAERNPDRIRLIDATQPVDAVHKRICQEVGVALQATR
jgi:dTMP kinase